MFNHEVSVIVAHHLYLVDAVDHRHGHETDSQSVCQRIRRQLPTSAERLFVELGFRSKGVAKVTPGCVLELHSVGGCKKNGKEQCNLITAHLLRCFGFY